jgi:hypothetical protein
MVNLKTIRIIIFALTGTALIIIIASKSNTERRNGHLVKITHDPQGNEIVTHVDSCGCWTMLNDKPE